MRCDCRFDMVYLQVYGTDNSSVIRKDDSCSLSEIESGANEALVLLSNAPQSTLEVFARQGGLALLAEHLQLYQPTVSVQNFR